jgi:hypothetical protein
MSQKINPLCLQKMLWIGNNIRFKNVDSILFIWNDNLTLTPILQKKEFLPDLSLTLTEDGINNIKGTTTGLIKNMTDIVEWHFQYVYKKCYELEIIYVLKM